MADRKRTMAKVDWGAARAFYVGLGEDRSFANVAIQFRVSKRAVEQHAKREGWKRLAVAADAKAAERAQEYAVRSLQERQRDTLRLIDEARARALDALVSGELEVRLADLPPLLKHELLLDGQATEVVAVAEVQQRITLIVQTILPFVPGERRGEAIEKLRAIRGIGEGEAA